MDQLEFKSVVVFQFPLFAPKAQDIAQDVAKIWARIWADTITNLRIAWGMVEVSEFEAVSGRHNE